VRLKAGLANSIPGREAVCARSVNAVFRPGNTVGKPGSGVLAVLEHELELGQNHVPISTQGGPVFDKSKCILCNNGIDFCAF